MIDKTKTAIVTQAIPPGGIISVVILAITNKNIYSYISGNADNHYLEALICLLRAARLVKGHSMKRHKDEDGFLLTSTSMHSPVFSTGTQL